ncbi:MAG: HigA family addiction module antitoxin [Cyanobacteria bacterium J06629_19]
MKMHNPPPPREIILEDYLKPLNIGASELADSLDLPVQIVSQMLDGDRPIDADMAHRLSLATKTTAESWLDMQQAYDLWRTEQEGNYSKVRELITA